MNQLSESQISLINAIVSNNNINNFDIEVNAGSQKGDNYLSITKAVKIKERNSSKVLNLFIKCAQESVELRKQIPIEKVFLREANLYEITFPAFLSFYKSKSARYEFPVIARYFGKCLEQNEEWLMFEDLKARGFKSPNRKETMDRNHIKLVFKEYGKLHALSLAVKDQKPKEFEKIKSTYTDIFSEVMDMEDAGEKYKPNFDRAIKLLDDEEQIRKLEVFKESLVNFFDELNNEKSVLVHGDCWSSNMLFKYEDEEKPSVPTKVCFIDYQISRVTTPVIDLCYFLFINSSKEVYNSFKDYLHIYHESVSRMLKELGTTDVDSVFPYSELKRHWKKYCKFGLFVAVMFLKVMLSDSSEIPDLQEVSKSGHFMEAFEMGAKTNQVYERRLKDLVSFMIDNDFL